MSDVACFMLEPAMKARKSLRRDVFSSKAGAVLSESACPSADNHGYHNAFTYLGDVDASQEPNDDSWVWRFDDGPDIPHDDPRWPTQCSCGRAFADVDEYQIFHDLIWRANDGREFADEWFIDGPANNGPMGWTRTGTVPRITVSPSIQCNAGSTCYHGWLRDGVLTSA